MHMLRSVTGRAERVINMEKAANSYIINVESGAEMARLIDQDKFVTKCMGGLFPEIPDLAKVGSTLDVACGPGGWAQELAYTYPDMRVVGIDISQRMIEYAKALSQVQGLDNAEFRVMDLLQPLDFPDASFDLINARFLVGFVHADGWVPLLMQAFYLDGRNLSGSPSHVGLTPLLGRFLREVGCQNVQEKVHLLNYSAGMEAYTGVCEDVRVGFKLVQPFLVKMKVAEQEEVEQLYEQTLAEWLSEDFRGLWYFLSAWGQKPV